MKGSFQLIKSGNDEDWCRNTVYVIKELRVPIACC